MSCMGKSNDAEMADVIAPSVEGAGGWTTGFSKRRKSVVGVMRASGEERAAESPSVLTSSEVARALVEQPWRTLGQGEAGSPVAATSSEERMIDQITSILEMRVNALVASRAAKRLPADCRVATITGTTASSELRLYVTRIAGMYRSVGYHSLEHATHVTVSLNKLISMLVDTTHDVTCTCHAGDSAVPTRRQEHRRSSCPSHVNTHHGLGGGHLRSCPCGRPSSTFGIFYDALAQLALVFSALVHDVDHTGLTNRQLVLEQDELAILYHDQSVAEHNSLRIAFSVLQEPSFAELRHTILSTADDKFRFRRIVIDMLLCTDISSPERVQIGKSKWREAFQSAEDSSSPQSILGRRRTMNHITHHNDGSHLGIKRALNLSGTTIELYPPSPDGTHDLLKASVVLEQMMQAADVAHTMQDWDVFMKWNGRLFDELNDAFLAGRGDDPRQFWYNGQISFYDLYVLPLASRMKQCGVFAEAGADFEQLALKNKRRWIEEGAAVCTALEAIAEAKQNKRILDKQQSRSLSSSSLAL